MAYEVSEVSTVLTIENGIIEVQNAINFREGSFMSLGYNINRVKRLNPKIMEIIMMEVVSNTTYDWSYNWS